MSADAIGRAGPPVVAPQVDSARGPAGGTAAPDATRVPAQSGGATTDELDARGPAARRSAEPAPGARGAMAAPGSTGPAKADADGDSFQKVFATLAKLGDNLFAQGGLAIASSLVFIPGVAQIASTVGAIVTLSSFINSVMNGKPDWGALGSGALYLGGMIWPGVGAGGGLLRMMTLSKPTDAAEQAQTRPRTAPVTPEPYTEVLTPQAEPVPAGS